MVERIAQRRTAQALMDAGVTLADPARIDVRGELVAGADVSIDVGCIFEGRVELADGVRVGAYLRAARLFVRRWHGAAAVHVRRGFLRRRGRAPGPVLRLRPGNTLDDQVHIGNFVEIKASTIGRGSKANHLAYVGDSTVGRDVNVGAGTITANYDGANKHKTIIGDGASIGSNAVLVAPVTIGPERPSAAARRLPRTLPKEADRGARAAGDARSLAAARQTEERLTHVRHRRSRRHARHHSSAGRRAAPPRVPRL